MSSLHELAPAKVNLSLHVLGRRTDGYHELESLVVFADCADELWLDPGPKLTLAVEGETAEASGPFEDNLVLKAARALGDSARDLLSGTFSLKKRLPVAAGLGSGSADAAAALRLLARLNGFDLADQRILNAARTTGADCTVCLRSRPALIRGIGEEVEHLTVWPRLDAVLVNPRVAVPTRPVFEALRLAPGVIDSKRGHPSAIGEPFALLQLARNDLAPAARSIAPVIADVETALANSGARIVRMSGSGATVVGLYISYAQSREAARAIALREPKWWVQPVTLGGA